MNGAILSAMVILLLVAFGDICMAAFSSKLTREEEQVEKEKSIE